jgi:SPFH domain / Band 7 family
MGLLNWGIERIDNFEKDLRLLSKRLGYRPLSWREVVMINPSKDGLVWRVPDPDVLMASSLSHIQALLVSENEQVMLLWNGALMRGMERSALLQPGLYLFRRVEMHDQLEIIWTTTREFPLPWGVTEVLTSDRISIGASGHYRVAIEDPEKFFFQVLGNAQVYKEEQLTNFTRPEITALLRDLIARKTVMEFLLARQEFIAACQQKLQPIFEEWGLLFRSLSIEHDNIPEEFRRAAAARTRISMEKEAEIEGKKGDIALAQLGEVEAYYLAKGESHKSRAQREIEIESMRQLQEIGIDPLELKRIEAAHTLAANPGPNALNDARPQIASQLLGQPATPYRESVTIVPIDSLQISPPELIQGSVSEPLTDNAAPVSAPTDDAQTREQIEEVIDKLEERFAKGEITEPTFLKLRERWQKKLDTMS